ncbi:MAG: mandelate racemase/muconate lactonizing enzyme family protein, partial [Anaerolineales bacterium]
MKARREISWLSENLNQQMQISKAEVIPVEIPTKQPIEIGLQHSIREISVIFIRLETRRGQSAWGCTLINPEEDHQKFPEVLHACQECATKIVDLHPLNLAYTLAELTPLCQSAPAALCAFDLALHDLLGIASGLPLYRLLGGYRNTIETSITIPRGSIDETIQLALEYSKQGFHIFKVKGGLDPELDVERIRSLHRALPYATIRLDADGGYSIERAINVAQALRGILEFLEQPTPPKYLDDLHQVTKLSPVPILADQSACGIDSALEIAAKHSAHGLSIKIATCGGIRNAIEVDTIARAAHLSTMVSCSIEPALLIAAGLSLALASPSVRYGDLDGFLFLKNDPTQASFVFQDGCMTATEVPGLG